MVDGVDGQEGTEWFSASSSVPVPGAAVDVPVVAVASTTPVAKVWLLVVADPAKNGAFRHLTSCPTGRLLVGLPHQFAHA